MQQLRILCVSFDKTVSDSRRALLEEAGYAVTAITAPEMAVELLAKEEFDLLIIGHRFAKSDKQRLAAQAREQSKTRVLLVCGASADEDIPADARVYALEGSEGLLAAVKVLLSAHVSVSAA